MRNSFLLFCIMYIFLLGSCTIPDPDKRPFSFYFYIRIAKGIERKVSYNTENKIFEIPEYISFENKIISQISEFNPISWEEYYVNYSEPFELYINIKLLSRDIKEIIFQRCSLITDENEYNLFDSMNENIKLSEFKTLVNDIGGSAGPYKGDFYDGYKFIVNNDDQEYFSGYSLGFKKLPFDYVNDYEVEIIYDVLIIDKNGNSIAQTISAMFTRTYLKKEIEKENVFWKEIDFDEWKEHL